MNDDDTVYLGYVDNLYTREWHAVGLMTYEAASACRARSTNPDRLIIIDPETYDELD